MRWDGGAPEQSAGRPGPNAKRSPGGCWARIRADPITVGPPGTSSRAGMDRRPDGRPMMAAPMNYLCYATGQAEPEATIDLRAGNLDCIEQVGSEEVSLPIF